MSLTTKDLIATNCKCGDSRKEVIPQVKAIEQARLQEQERILNLLGTYSNPAWRRHHLEAIKQLIS